MINKNSKIFVAGHKGLVGSAILRKLENNGYKKIITAKRSHIDKTNQHTGLRLVKKKTEFYFHSCC